MVVCIWFQRLHMCRSCSHLLNRDTYVITFWLLMIYPILSNKKQNHSSKKYQSNDTDYQRRKKIISLQFHWQDKSSIKKERRMKQYLSKMERIQISNPIAMTNVKVKPLQKNDTWTQRRDIDKHMNNLYSKQIIYQDISFPNHNMSIKPPATAKMK